MRAIIKSWGLAAAMIFPMAAPAVAPLQAVVFVGDSITAGGPWTIGCNGAINLGVNSGTSHDALRVSAEIGDLKPRRVVLMIGVNDIALGVHPDETVRNIATIAALAKAPMTIHAILPVTAKYPRAGFNAKIDALNARIGAEFAQTRLSMRQYDYLPDGIHLRPTGYDRWLAVLNRTGVCH